jgi:hypothetical protein
MAAPTKVNNPNVEVLINHKQSELPSENTLETPGRPNKRRNPESPEDLPATSKQQTRQTRHRSTSVGGKGRCSSISALMLASTELFIESVIDSLILSDKMGMILSRTSGLVSASITCTVIGFFLHWSFFGTLKQTLKEQQKRIDEQKEMISNQAHLVVQRIQEEQHLKSSLKEKVQELDSL